MAVSLRHRVASARCGQPWMRQGPLALRWLAEMRLDDLPRLRARDDRYDFEGNPGSAPAQHPLLEKQRIVTAHQLEAARKAWLDPAVDESQAIRKPAARFAQP